MEKHYVVSGKCNDVFIKLGKSLLNLATLFTGNETPDPAVARAKPKPKDTPIMPRRPPRRKLGLDRSRHKSLTGGENQCKVEETIAEVESPSDSPVLEPKVRMPGEAPPLSLSSPGVRKPSVPQPGQARVPSPTSTVNTLELIGSPVSSRPRVQQPRAGCLPLSPGLGGRIPKYENTAELPGEPTVAMPGTPSQTVKVSRVCLSVCLTVSLPGCHRVTPD